MIRLLEWIESSIRPDAGEQKMQRELSNEITEKSLLGISIPACPASLTAIMREAKTAFHRSGASGALN
jgi:hypothetical protein